MNTLRIRLLSGSLAAIVVASFLMTCPTKNCFAEDSLASPNIILILIDDMGFSDLSCMGSTYYETPSIDKLAASGMRFTHAYSACTVCSPTRAAVLTGKYPARLHLTDWIPGQMSNKTKLKLPEWNKQLNLEEITLAELLGAHGYTTASIGKWHLGPPECEPTRQGFSLNIGGNSKGQPPSYFFPYERNGVLLPGLAEGKPNEYLTDRLTDACEAFIEENQSKPFFLYLPHYCVHTPLQAKPELIAKYEAKNAQFPGNPQHEAKYAAMVESLDQSVGRIMAKLDALDLTKKTIVIFTSDNGGLVLREITSNLPARAGKGSAYEGGVRVPLIVSYPPMIKPGTTCDVPAISMDLFPTLAELSGAKYSHDIDGKSIVPLLEEKPDAFAARPLYWHYPHYHGGGATPYSAMREGNYRLVEFFEDGRLELYDLAHDIGEKKNLAQEKPDLTEKLHRQLIAWRKSVDAQYATPREAEPK